MSENEESIEGKKILLIVGGTYNVDAAARFLIRRKVETKIVNKVTDAVTEIVKYKPDYVFYSISHPNKKVRNLPKFLVQHFNVRCIAFAEDSSPQIMHRLTTTKNAYKMMSSPTGPNFLRYIQQMLQEFNKKGESKSKQERQKSKDLPSSQEDRDEASSASRAEESSMIHLKGESGQNSNEGSQFVVVKGGTAGEKNSEAPGQRQIHWGKAATSQEGKATLSAAQLGSDETKRGKAEFTSSTGLEEESPPNGGFFSDSSVSEEVSTGDQSLIDMLSRTLGSKDEDDNHEEDLEFSDEREEDENSLTIFEDALKDADQIKGFAETILSESADIDLAKPLKEMEDNSGLRSGTSIFFGHTGQSEYAGMSEDFTIALDRKESDLEPHQLFDPIGSFFVIPMTHASKLGFALLACDQEIEEKVERKLITYFKTQIFSKLSGGGTKFSLGKSVRMEVEKRFDFEKLISNNVVPISTFKFETKKWSLLFLDHDCPQPKLDGKREDQKIPVQLNDLPINTPTLVDIYIFLSKNKKFFLYLRKGRVFSEKQKDKFSNQNRTIFIDEHDLDQFIAFYVKNEIQKFLKTVMSVAA